MPSSMPTMMPMAVFLPVIRPQCGLIRAAGCRSGPAWNGTVVFDEAALDDLVELASIEPNAATLGTIVDFDALAFAHHKVDAASGAGEPAHWCVVYHDTS